LKRENIYRVYFGGYIQEAGLILRPMRDQGLKTVLDGRRLARRQGSSPRPRGLPLMPCCSQLPFRSAQQAEPRKRSSKISDQE